MLLLFGWIFLSLVPVHDYFATIFTNTVIEKSNHLPFTEFSKKNQQNLSSNKEFHYITTSDYYTREYIYSQNTSGNVMNSNDSVLLGVMWVQWT